MMEGARPRREASRSDAEFLNERAAELAEIASALRRNPLFAQEMVNRVGRALLEQPVDHLLGEQRVAAGALGDLGDQVRALPFRLGSRRSDQLARLVVGQRLEGDRGRVAAAPAPVGAAVQQLVAGQADDQQRARAPSGRGARSGRAFPRRPSGCPRSRGPAAAPARPPRSRRGRPRRGSRASAAGPRSACRRLVGRLDAERAARSGRRFARSPRRSASSPISSRRPRGASPRPLRRVVGVADPELAPRSTSPSAQ